MSRSRTNHVHGERCINIEQLRHSSIQPHGNLHAKCLHIVRGYVFSKSSVNRWIRVKFGYCIVPLQPCCCCCRDIRLTGIRRGTRVSNERRRLNNCENWRNSRNYVIEKCYNIIFNDDHRGGGHCCIIPIFTYISEYLNKSKLHWTKFRARVSSWMSSIFLGTQSKLSDSSKLTFYRAARYEKSEKRRIS